MFWTYYLVYSCFSVVYVTISVEITYYWGYSSCDGIISRP